METLDWDLLEAKPVSYLGRLLCYETVFYKIERYGLRRVYPDDNNN